MARRRSARRKPLSVARAVRQTTTFQDPASEALVQYYVSSVAARTRRGGLDPATEEAIRRAIADRVAVLAATHGALPPRTLTLHAINSFTRPTDPDAVLAEAERGRPKEPTGKVVVHALKQALVVAANVGLGPIPRYALIVVLFVEQLVAGFRGRSKAKVEVPIEVRTPVPVVEAASPPAAARLLQPPAPLASG